MLNDRWPQRIVCLTEETTELLYLLGEQDRIVGISGFTVRPPIARKEKPKISAFTSAKESKILDLKPDLVFAFSDMQADIVADLVRAGLQVHVFNQRTVAGIFQMMTTVGRLLSVEEKTDALAVQFQEHLDEVVKQGSQLKRKPIVYFEEWNDPMMACIQWVSELIEIAGGVNCCKDLSMHPDGKSRIIADPQRIIDARPDIIIGSWCGRRFRSEHIHAREGWADIPALKTESLYEIRSPIILQPGPASLTEGVSALLGLFQQWDASV
ncbi:MAG: cobalamin-binding protein [Pseudomonadales bacterium]|nr:cobalamin-binding protein [Pseudomonadales bacterium]